MTSSPILLVLSAPSGAGKTTIVQGLLAENPGLRRVVTCSTRPPRPGERQGVDYQFLNAGEFAARLKADAFLEHADVYGHQYGTLRQDVMKELASGHDVVLVVDVQGVISVQQAAAADPQLRTALVTVFITTKTLPELEARLRGRGTEAEEVIQRRLATAKQEMVQWWRFDYLVLSGSREDDRRQVQAILDAEKLRQSRSGFTPPS
jgi:guanylate kinase